MSKKKPVAMDLTKATTAEITATIEPSSATNKNTIWSSDAQEYATVTESDNPATISAVAAGSATITCATEDGSFTDTVAVTVTGGGG